MFLGANTSECESSRERKFPGPAISLRGAKVPGSEKAKERKGQGANGPRNESSRERIGQGPIGRFAPGSEKAVNHDYYIA